MSEQTFNPYVFAGAVAVIVLAWKLLCKPRKDLSDNGVGAADVRERIDESRERIDEATGTVFSAERQAEIIEGRIREAEEAADRSQSEIISGIKCIRKCKQFINEVRKRGKE